MRRALLILLLLPLTPHGAAAASANGLRALPLATIVGERSPTLSARRKATLAALLDGHRTFPRRGGPIVVRADGVVCRSSDVDLTSRSCVLTFGKRTVGVAGRKAHEIFATLEEVGVPSDGAAGTIFEALTQLRCTITREIATADGGGARCVFKTGQ